MRRRSDRFKPRNYVQFEKFATGFVHTLATGFLATAARRVLIHMFGWKVGEFIWSDCWRWLLSKFIEISHCSRRRNASKRNGNRGNIQFVRRCLEKHELVEMDSSVHYSTLPLTAGSCSHRRVNSTRTMLRKVRDEKNELKLKRWKKIKNQKIQFAREWLVAVCSNHSLLFSQSLFSAAIHTQKERERDTVTQTNNHTHTQIDKTLHTDTSESVGVQGRHLLLHLEGNGKEQSTMQ